MNSRRRSEIIKQKEEIRTLRDTNARLNEQLRKQKEHKQICENDAAATKKQLMQMQQRMNAAEQRMCNEISVIYDVFAR